MSNPDVPRLTPERRADAVGGRAPALDRVVQGKMTVRLTWRREPHQPNRASWGRERGWELRYKHQAVGAVYPRYELGNGMPSGWYWSSRNQTLGIPLRNTASEPVPTADEAKASCLAYVQEQLKRGECRNGWA